MATPESPNELPIPQHVAIIMDGNGRWAKQHNLPRVEGHRAGAENVLRTVKAAQAIGIKYITLYAFSTENWKRSIEEVTALMNLLGEFLDRYLPEIQANNVRLRAIGEIERIPFWARRKLKAAIAATENNTDATLTFALSYGGRREITDAVQKIARDVLAKKIAPEAITEDTLQSALYAPDIPDPELMIRTSGEFRTSNFLIWQLAYSEFYITPVLWPDFDENIFREAVQAYQKRERRFGERPPEK